MDQSGSQMNAAPEKPAPAGDAHSRTASAQRRGGNQRAFDFIFLISAMIAVLAGICLAGEISIAAAVIAGTLIVLFGVIYLNGTADVAGAALRAGQVDIEADERALRVASEKGFRAAMINALPEPTMYIDEQGRVETANAAALREFRFVAPEPLLSMVVRRPELLDSVAEVRRDGKVKLFELVMREETDRYFAGVAAPVATHQSRGVLVAMHDLTEIKRAEFARVDFLANASHELRTPLTSLAGFIETLKGPAKDDPEARARFLDIMEGQAERMRGLINDLMSLSRIELIEHRTPVSEADLAAVVGEVCDALMPVARARDVKLEIDGPTHGMDVMGVHDELTQVAQNLIDNAIKYSGAGQTVRIALRAGSPHGAAVQFAGRQWGNAGRMSIASASAHGGKGGYAAMRVVDEGPGIDRQHLPRLAERFYRVDQGRGLRPGTGLGLAIVKHIVTRHRGELLVESDPGRGAAFGVVLPEPVGARRPGEAEVEANAGKTAADAN